MSAERFFRAVSNRLSEKPGRFLAEKGIPANLVTVGGLVMGHAAEVLVFNNYKIEDKIREVTGGRFTISAEAIKSFGIGLFGLSLYLDILDGKVARNSKAGPTKFGSNADNFTDGAIETSIGVQAFMSAQSDEERKVWERFFKKVRQPSIIRAAGEAHGVEISEIDIGSRLARMPGEILLLVSERHRLTLAKFVTLQAEASVTWRLFAILKSGNKTALAEALMDLGLQEVLFDVSRVGNPGNLRRNLLSQGISVGFSAFAKARRTLLHSSVKR